MPDLSADLPALGRDYQQLREAVSSNIIGQTDTIDMALTALLAGGHLLLEGVPGLGKTQIVRAIAAAIEGDFRRIQFTPDLMPADLIGTYIVMEAHGRRKFEFQQGPLFANVVLCDEVNRATPKTQSALLEAMEDGACTVANQTYDLPQPFFVMATQSPLEVEGTYPLPATQLDRFLFMSTVAFPQADELEKIIEQSSSDVDLGGSVLSAERIAEMQQLARQVAVDPAARSLAAKLVLATHPDQKEVPDLVRRYVQYGSSPRGGRAMLLGAKARAAAAGKSTATADDVKALAPAALRHRLILNYAAGAEQVTAEQIVAEVIASL